MQQTRLKRHWKKNVKLTKQVLYNILDSKDIEKGSISNYSYEWLSSRMIHPQAPLHFLWLYIWTKKFFYSNIYQQFCFCMPRLFYNQLYIFSLNLIFFSSLEIVQFFYFKLCFYFSLIKKWRSQVVVHKRKWIHSFEHIH